MWHEIESLAGGERVTFSQTFEGARRERPQGDRTTLRFLDTATLDRFLGEAGFVVERYGDWPGGRGRWRVPAPRSLPWLNLGADAARAYSS